MMSSPLTIWNELPSAPDERQGVVRRRTARNVHLAAGILNDRLIKRAR